MNTVSKLSIGSVFLTLLGTSALADPYVVSGHNGMAGPKRDAVIECLQAVHNSSIMGTGLVLSKRVQISKDASGARTYTLTGFAWENGKRVPVTARCDMGRGNTVARIARVVDDTSIADTRRHQKPLPAGE